MIKQNHYRVRIAVGIGKVVLLRSSTFTPYNASHLLVFCGWERVKESTIRYPHTAEPLLGSFTTELLQ